MNKVEWFGEIPFNWKVYKIQSLFKNRNIKVSDKDYEPLSVTKSGIYPQLENVAKSNDSENRKLVLSGDFVINSRSDRKQSCGVSPYDGSVSLINTIIFPYKNLVDMNYISFLLDNYGFAEEFYRWGHGIVADLWTTRWQEMANIEIPIPPLHEQIEIYKELKEKSLSIDQLIQNQQQQIEKMKDYKQSLITSFFDKYVFDLQEHKGSLDNNAVPLNYLSKIVRGNTGFRKDELLSEGDFIGLQYGKTYKTEIVDETYNFYVDSKFYKEDQIVNKGDVILISTSETVEDLGHACFYDREELGLLGGEQFILKPNEEIIYGKFLYFCTVEFSKYIKKYCTGLKVYRFNSSHLKNIYINLPKYDEQKRIVHLLDKKILAINSLLDLKQTKINHLNDYKKSLIYEYVTGKKAVS